MTTDISINSHVANYSPMEVSGYVNNSPRTVNRSNDYINDLACSVLSICQKKAEEYEDRPCVTRLNRMKRNRRQSSDWGVRQKTESDKAKFDDCKKNSNFVASQSPDIKKPLWYSLESNDHIIDCSDILRPSVICQERKKNTVTQETTEKNGEKKPDLPDPGVNCNEVEKPVLPEKPITKDPHKDLADSFIVPLAGLGFALMVVLAGGAVCILCRHKISSLLDLLDREQQNPDIGAETARPLV